MLLHGLTKASICALATTAIASGPMLGTAAADPVREHVDLSRTAKHGSSKFTFDGHATGTFNGPVHADVTLVHSLILSGTVTVRTRNGTIRMKLNGRTRSATARAKFNGTAKVIGGTGRYKAASGSARFSGIVNRATRTWHTTIDVTGSFES